MATLAGLLTMLGALLLLPVLPWAMGIVGPVTHVYTDTVPAENKGTYLVTDQGVMQLFTWRVEVPEFPADAPALSASTLREVAVVQRAFEEPAAFQLLALDDGGQIVPWAGSREGTGQLRLLLPPLPPGRYELVIPTDSSFGGVTRHFFVANGPPG